jgi:hypothetical protein
LWPPQRTAISIRCSRPKLTAATTSPVPERERSAPAACRSLRCRARASPRSQGRRVVSPVLAAARRAPWCRCVGAYVGHRSSSGCLDYLTLCYSQSFRIAIRWTDGAVRRNRRRGRAGRVDGGVPTLACRCAGAFARPRALPARQAVRRRPDLPRRPRAPRPGRAGRRGHGAPVPARLPLRAPVRAAHGGAADPDDAAAAARRAPRRSRRPRPGPTFATESGRPRSSSRTTERSFASAARRRRRRSCSGPTG